jgi:hypothetical protein
MLKITIILCPVRQYVECVEQIGDGLFVQFFQISVLCDEPIIMARRSKNNAGKGQTGSYLFHFFSAPVLDWASLGKA